MATDPTARQSERRAGVRLVTLAALVLGALTVSPRWAHAGGLYYSERGVRPLARGGAFVAGADDLGAIFYNPAGLVDAQSQILVDAAWMNYTSTYQRQVLLNGTDPNTGAPVGSSVETFPSVKGTTPILPIPTIAGSYAIRPDLVIAAGVYAPYAAIPSYPATVGGQPSPQRYSLINLNGSLLSVIGAWIAWRPLPWLQLGGGPQFLVGNFESQLTLGTCVPEHFFCAPEDPNYDAQATLKAGTIVSPSGTFGIILTPHQMVRLGGAFQLGYHVDSPATLQTVLPSAPVFQNASISGNQARVQFDLPWVARAGVEVRPLRRTRIEAAFEFERWSVHQSIQVNPQNLTIQNISLIGNYTVGPLSIDRSFRDSYSLRLGGEQNVPINDHYSIDLRAGVAYERSAIPPDKLSALTIDLDKVFLSVGGGLHVGEHWRFDGVFSYIYGIPETVNPAQAAIYKVNPLRANFDPSQEYPINGGSYSVNALVLGVGLEYQF